MPRATRTIPPTTHKAKGSGFPVNPNINSNEPSKTATTGTAVDMFAFSRSDEFLRRPDRSDQQRLEAFGEFDLTFRDLLEAGFAERVSELLVAHAQALP